MPGLDAEKRRARGLRPHAELTKSFPGHFNRWTAIGHEADRTALRPVQNDRIVVEQPFRKGKRVGANRGGLRRGSQQAVFQPADRRGFLPGEHQPVVLLGHSGKQRPIEGGMGADRSRQHFVTRIGDFESHAQIGVLQRIGHRQPERERIASPGGGIVGKLQSAGMWLTLPPIEPTIACKAMLRHRIEPSPVPQFVVLQPADDGEQDGRMARPLRTGLPKQLESGGVLQRAQFSAIRRDGRGHHVIVEREAVAGHVSRR